MVGREEAFEKSVHLLESAPVGSVMAVDTETNGFSVRLGARVTVVSVAWRASDGVGHALALPFGQGQGSEKLWAPTSAWELLMEKLRLNDLVMFHAHFDHGMLRAGNMRDRGIDLGAQVHWDGMVAEKIMAGGASGGLKPTGERYGVSGGGERDDEEVMTRWLGKRGMGKGDIHKVPWHIIHPYARTDAVLTLTVCEAQKARLALMSPSVQAAVEAKMNALRLKLGGTAEVELDMEVA